MSSEAPAFDIDVERAFGDTRIALRITAGPGLTVLFGPSGAGKSSTLNMVAGLLRPDRGHVRLDGRTLFDRQSGVDLPPEHRSLGYIFQDGRLFPHLRVEANLLYGHCRHRAGSHLADVTEIVDLLGIGHLLHRWPRSLSGGEAQRVAIGRALLSGARALLMDEPLSSLDPPRREEIMRLIERVRDDIGLPILYVTHDQAEAERLGTRRIGMGFSECRTLP